MKEDHTITHPSIKLFLGNKGKLIFRGVRNGQLLFERYMPLETVQLLKESDYWEVPYRFDHPVGLQFVCLFVIFLF